MRDESSSGNFLHPSSFIVYTALPLTSGAKMGTAPSQNDALDRCATSITWEAGAPEDGDSFLH
jgi:hypothetical protein